MLLFADVCECSDDSEDSEAESASGWFVFEYFLWTELLIDQNFNKRIVFTKGFLFIRKGQHPFLSSGCS